MPSPLCVAARARCIGGGRAQLAASDIPGGRAQLAASDIPGGRAQLAASNIPGGRAQLAAGDIPGGRAQLAAVGSLLAVVLLLLSGGAGRAAAQSAKLTRPLPEWGVNAAIESDLLRTVPARSAKANDKDPPRKQRVLLVGNSYTNFNLLHVLIERLAESSGGQRLKVEVEARPGYSLRMHLKSRNLLAKIRNGHFSHVVLQGHSLSAIDHPDELAEDAAHFTDTISAAGARTVLYETWARKPGTALYRKHTQVRSFETMADRIATAYSGIARRLQIGLAPVGGAFERAWRSDPRVPLWGADGSHPTLAGSYMAACVLFGAITGRDPRDATWEPHPLDRRLAERVRAMAAASLAGTRVLPAEVSTTGSSAIAAASRERRGPGLPDSARASAVSTKPNRATAKSPGPAPVAASMAAFMGRAPGQIEAPDVIPDAHELDSQPASSATPEPAPNEGAPTIVPESTGERASMAKDGANFRRASLEMPLLSF